MSDLDAEIHATRASRRVGQTAAQAGQLEAPGGRMALGSMSSNIDGDMIDEQQYHHELDDEEVDEQMYARHGNGVNLEAERHAALGQSSKHADDPFAAYRPDRIIDREDEYKSRGRERAMNVTLSPTRKDAFADEINQKHDNNNALQQENDNDAGSYKTVMMKNKLAREEQAIMRNIEKKKQEEANMKRALEQAGQHQQAALVGIVNDNTTTTAAAAAAAAASSSTTDSSTRKRRRWDSSSDNSTSGAEKTTSWDATPLVHSQSSDQSSSSDAWDATPSRTERRSKSRWGMTPSATNTVEATPVSSTQQTAAWDATPVGTSAHEATPSGRKRSRWGETPTASVQTQHDSTSSFVTKALGEMTPSTVAKLSAEELQALRIQAEIDERNRPYTDEELDQLLPGPKDGYEIQPVPENYTPLRTPSRKLMMTPLPMASEDGYVMPTTMDASQYDIPATPAETGLPSFRKEEEKYFGALLQDVDESALSTKEQKERRIMKLLLKIKNGTPPQRKTALRTIADKARDFGAGPLFDQLLPLLTSETLEDQERHVLVKVIDRVLYKLDDLVRPYVHNILLVIAPMLIDEDYYARVEGREIISNLAKAAGLATMIATMRPDIDNPEEYVRNTTSRAFAVVASALGIHQLLPFLKAVCQSKRSWEARHTGIKIVQQIAILMGCAILPHLKSLIDTVAHGLDDEQMKVKTMTALALSALAEAAAPYGIEAFDNVLRPLWKGIRTHRGKTLAAFFKAIGYIIPLMDPVYASYCTKEVMPKLIEQFSTSDEEMKKIVLKVVKQCVNTEGVEIEYIRKEIIPPFFQHFWVPRMALDRRNYKELVDTTEALALKVGGALIIGQVVDFLKHESEPFRKMTMETIEKVMSQLGAIDIDGRLEQILVDALLYAFAEQTDDDSRIMLNGFGVVINALGQRSKAYLPQICGIIKFRLNNKLARVRQQAADLMARIALIMKACNEESLLCHLGVVFYEYLGEEYPDVLGSILGGLKAIVNVVGMDKMTPPIRDLLPRLTPILRNRHEKVQENCIDLVGRIADRGSEHVPAKEWMRICFELLELLKAPKKGIRRASVNCFGYIARAIGPHDVMATLLNNLKVQERQNRVCTTVAIAIVAETCSPFTILPALMNEYRVRELNVQNGVLKSLSFIFEYIGEMGKDYVYAVTPLLEDALMDRDMVHRQTASTVVKHLALGVAGLNREDAMLHLLNYIWPNIFETSPHLINAVCEAIESLRVALGPTKILQYILQGLFHPARSVRTIYWKLYNTLYIASQDALVPAYPRMANDKETQYRRWELETFL